jgi:hypothetical protein
VNSGCTVRTKQSFHTLCTFGADSRRRRRPYVIVLKGTLGRRSLTSNLSVADTPRRERAKVMARQGVAGVDPVFSRKASRCRRIAASSLRLSDTAPTPIQVHAFIRARAPTRAA